MFHRPSGVSATPGDAYAAQTRVSCIMLAMLLISSFAVHLRFRHRHRWSPASSLLSLTTIDSTAAAGIDSHAAFGILFLVALIVLPLILAIIFLKQIIDIIYLSSSFPTVPPPLRFTINSRRDRLGLSDLSSVQQVYPPLTPAFMPTDPLSLFSPG